MFKANLEDGRTVEFDLTFEDDLEEWNRRRADATFQASIRAIIVVTRDDDGNASSWVVKRPTRFHGAVVWDIDDVYDPKRGKHTRERVHVYAGDCHQITTVYIDASPARAHTELIRTGKLRAQGFAATPTKR